MATEGVSIDRMRQKEGGNDERGEGKMAGASAAGLLGKLLFGHKKRYQSANYRRGHINSIMLLG